jgi:hypothetical protein
MPRVYDKQGNELTVGAIVEETKTRQQGGYRGHVEALGQVGPVWVAAVDFPGLTRLLKSKAHPGVFHAASDLLLIDSEGSA